MNFQRCRVLIARVCCPVLRRLLGVIQGFTDLEDERSIEMPGDLVGLLLLG